MQTYAATPPPKTHEMTWVAVAMAALAILALLIPSQAE